VWIGSVVTALLFNAGKLLIGLYIGKSSVASGFGAAGSLAILLLWVYYSAQVFLLGAEFTRVFAQTHGSMQSTPVQARADAKAAAPVQRPVTVTQPSAAKTASANKAKAVSASKGNMLQRHLLAASAVAAALGAATAFAVRKWHAQPPAARRPQPSRVRAPSTPFAPQRPRPQAAPLSPTRLALGVGSSATKMLATVVSSALASAIARGYKRGRAKMARREGGEPAPST
jgi:hypothetical protein